MSEETRYTDPTTGGQKGSKLSQIGAIDPLARIGLGEVAGFGAAKYDRWNYVKGYPWSLSIDAAHRHLEFFENGQDFDEESGLLHPLHFAWHGLTLATFSMRNRGTDDRISAFLQSLEN